MPSKASSMKKFCWIYMIMANNKKFTGDRRKNACAVWFLSPSSQLGLLYPHLSDPKKIFLHPNRFFFTPNLNFITNNCIKSCIWAVRYWGWSPEFWSKFLKHFIRILWSSFQTGIFNKEFHSHLNGWPPELWLKSFKNFRRILWSSNFLIGILLGIRNFQN